MRESSETIRHVRSFAVNGAAITFDIADGARVQLAVLAPDLLRVRITPQGAFTPNVSRAVVKHNWPAAPFDVADGPDHVTLTTAMMTIVVHKKPCLLTCLDPNGELVVADDPDHRIQWGGDRTEVFKRTQPGERYVGLGWRPLGLVRNGTRFVMRNRPTYDEPEVFNSGVPMWYGLREGKAYAIFFDDASWGTIDVGATSERYMSFRNTGGPLEYDYFAGPTMAGILDRYTELTGRPYIPPRWSLGYHQCRWSYTPQAQVLEIARELRSRRIPCDVIYLDIDYMPGGRALTFDPVKFPDPAGMIAELHEHGFRVVANISPILPRDDPKTPVAQREGHLLKNGDAASFWGRHFYWEQFGGGKTGDVVWLDFSNSAARRWWAAQHGPFIGLGIDGIWNDLNEPDELGGEWPFDVKYDYDGCRVDHAKAGTQYALLQAELSYDILRQHYPDRRPFVISRGGCAGIQRCATIWSGDNTANWTNDYRRNIPMGLSMSICGQPHNGHDIGGFFGHPGHEDPPDPELYARWMQAGVFSPFCRQHHDGFGNHPDKVRPMAEPWRFGERVERICRAFIELRYRLMPYLYTLFHRAHATGEPVQRPTLFDFPDDAKTLEQEYDFMFGPFLLVSPVTSPGVEAWETYLPAGAEWIDWWDDTVYEGGRTVMTAVPLERLPIFVRAGAIIPTGPVSQHDGQRPLSELTLEVYPGREAGQFTLHEDDGISWAFQQGMFCTTRYTVSPRGSNLRFEIAARQGRYQPSARRYLVRIHGWPAGATPKLDGADLPRYERLDELDAASEGWLLDAAAKVWHLRFADTGEGRLVVAG